jgi:hypothetical protein
MSLRSKEDKKRLIDIKREIYKYMFVTIINIVSRKILCLVRNKILRAILKDLKIEIQRILQYHNILLLNFKSIIEILFTLKIR